MEEGKKNTLKGGTTGQNEATNRMAIKCQPKSIMRAPHKCGNNLAKFVCLTKKREEKKEETKNGKQTEM